jgi:hypothetical protein
VYATPIVKGIATWIPGAQRFIKAATGGTDSARYCYSVWLRHLVMASGNGLSVDPKVVAELGPGDSLGIGLAALLTGADEYYAFDIFKYASYERNVAILDELVTLLAAREDIPGNDEVPDLRPPLRSYGFPSHVLSQRRLAEALEPDRVEAIRKDLRRADASKPGFIHYVVAGDTGVARERFADMVFSQAVLEHVNDLQECYQQQYRWLRPNGFISHQIDFKSHGLTKEWNGHWKFPTRAWKVVQGRRLYSMNRQPHSAHLRALESCGFTIVCDVRSDGHGGIRRAQLAREFRNMSSDDLTCSGAFIQAVKVAG